MEKGVGDKGDVGRRDVRQAAPVGRSAVFLLPFLPLLSPPPPLLLPSFPPPPPPPPVFPAVWPSAERIFHVLLSFLSAKRARDASLGIKEERRLQTAPATPREWRPSQTNRIPVSIPLRRRRRLRRELPSAPAPTRRRYSYPGCQLPSPLSLSVAPRSRPTLPVHGLPRFSPASSIPPGCRR